MEEIELQEIAQQLRKPDGEQGIKVGETMNTGNFHINKYTIEEVDAQANEILLEIGMGNGFFVKDILSKDASITYFGCDFSKDMVNESSIHNELYIQNGQAKFLFANADNLPIEDNTIDKLFTINTIYFWDNVTTVLNEIHRVLKPEGELVIAIRPKEEMETYPMTKYGFKMFSAEDLENILIDHDFMVLNTLEVEEKEQEFLETKMKDKFIITRASNQSI